MLASSRRMQQQLNSSCKKYRNGFFVPLSLLLLVLMLFSFIRPASSCTEQDKSSLLQFFAGLSQDGGLALSWQNGTDCCTWEGVACGTNRTVTDITLTSKGLEGHISASLGELTSLLRLNLSHNLFYGSLPLELLSSNSIIVLDVSFNRLNGDLRDLPSSTPGRPLQVLNISSNLFTGQFPSTTWWVMNNLIVLNASNNSFTGQIPSQFCNGSPGLTVLELCQNQFSGSIPPGLGNCSMLKVLKADRNKLSGPLPGELFRATSLEHLSFASNGLQGILDGAHIINLRKLVKLDLEGNNFSGRIPYSIGQLNRLEELRLDHNSMSGELPSTLSNCTNLMTIDLKSNMFSGELQKVNFFNLPNLKTLDLLYNNFTGTIPESIYSCSNLIALRLASNNLNGQLSPKIGNLKSLVFLSLASNNFTNITNTLQILKNSRNLTSLLIGTNFKGETMPEDETFEGFENLQLWFSRSTIGIQKERSRKATLGITFGVSVGVVVVLLLLVLLLAWFKGRSLIIKRKAYNNKDEEETSHMSDSEQSLVIVPRGKGGENKLRFADIVKATNKFHHDNIIGCGGCGLVYKATLPDGSKLAIKKLNGEMCLMEREFTAEVEALSMAQHDNLVPLWGYCIQGDSRLLIYSYMENGTLDDWLHNRDDDASSFLNWPMRLKIAQGASQGLAYIHDVCKPHIVHRDIKSSNILLDKEFKAYVADFGLSRLILANKTHVTTELVGTLGYIPPEYGQGWVATLRGDMYSFGIVLLELLTGRRPVQVMPSSKELVKWVQEMKSEGKQVEVLDPALRVAGHEEQMLKVLEVACKCINRNPCMRPKIQEVVSCLNSIDPKLQMQNSVKLERS
ncbi:hypothetical protein PR202_gb06253 [Eleusine coracana subsp. coracana]|uniref:non-specific serine/threonine protein kinase n=1 Tax=Eleusine coracana subsp. coracana TaxID=191504 RepID=A0AAV5E8G0_ELECO|nr:hypothetical protein PR202_gb06253 [Eleusine coracana subsp. coracana]